MAEYLWWLIRVNIESYTDGTTDLDISMQARVCVNENIPVVPIPGPSALVCALSASGLPTDEFKFGNNLYATTWFRTDTLCFSFFFFVIFLVSTWLFWGAVGFLPKHAGSRREKLKVSASETATQIFFVPPHKLHQFLDEASLIFGNSR